MQQGRGQDGSPTKEDPTTLHGRPSFDRLLRIHSSLLRHFHESMHLGHERYGPGALPEKSQEEQLTIHRWQRSEQES